MASTYIYMYVYMHRRLASVSLDGPATPDHTSGYEINFKMAGYAPQLTSHSQVLQPYRKPTQACANGNGAWVCPRYRMPPRCSTLWWLKKRKSARESKRVRERESGREREREREAAAGQGSSYLQDGRVDRCAWQYSQSLAGGVLSGEVSQEQQ